MPKIGHDRRTPGKPRAFEEGCTHIERSGKHRHDTVDGGLSPPRNERDGMSRYVVLVCLRILVSVAPTDTHTQTQTTVSGADRFSCQTAPTTDIGHVLLREVFQTRFFFRDAKQFRFFEYVL